MIVCLIYFSAAIYRFPSLWLHGWEEKQPWFQVFLNSVNQNNIVLMIQGINLMCRFALSFDLQLITHICQTVPELRLCRCSFLELWCVSCDWACSFCPLIYVNSFKPLLFFLSFRYVIVPLQLVWSIKYINTALWKSLSEPPSIFPHVCMCERLTDACTKESQFSLRFLKYQS